MTQSDWQNDVLRDLLRRTQAQLGGEVTDMAPADGPGSGVPGQGAEGPGSGVPGRGAARPADSDAAERGPATAGEAEASVAPAPGRDPLPRRRPNTAPSPDAGPGPSPSPPLDPDDHAADAPEPRSATPAARRTASLAARLAAGRAERPTPPTDAVASTAPDPTKPTDESTGAAAPLHAPAPAAPTSLLKADIADAEPTPEPSPDAPAPLHAPASAAPTSLLKADIADAEPTPEPSPEAPADALPTRKPPAPKPRTDSTGTSAIRNVSIEIQKKAAPTPIAPATNTDTAPGPGASTHTPEPQAPTPTIPAAITDTTPGPGASTHTPEPQAPTPTIPAAITDTTPTPGTATHTPEPHTHEAPAHLPVPHAPTPIAPTPLPAPAHTTVATDATPAPDAPIHTPAPTPPPNTPASHLPHVGPSPSAPPAPYAPAAEPTAGPAAPPTPTAQTHAPTGLPAPYHPAPVPGAQPYPPAPHTPVTLNSGARNPRLPAFTPESVPTVDPRLAGAAGRAQHGDTMARRTGHSLRRLASSAAQGGSEETRLARELQQPVANGRVIAVTSIRGGVGKTTVSALLARTLNHYRHDPVLALEADAALGTLPVRLGAESVRWSCPDLAQILKPSMQLIDVTGYLVPVTDGGWLLPASQGRVGAPLDVRTYRTVSLALRRHFAMTVVDCETLPGEVARTAMDTAHARVVVAPMTVEGVGGTRVVLDWLAQLPKAALASTVVALTSSAPDMTLDLKAATAHLRETGVAVVHLPYDRHLAAGGPIRTALLSEATRRAATGLAAEAVQRAAR
ncbi:hypothetical protein [Streptomyces sp. NPDC048527]|uniref:hypothetical protein n=1 Tax=Streptomyces sp. NPDC048527 TaxID=3365568 RepID=UPI0037245424